MNEGRIRELARRYPEPGDYEMSDGFRLLVRDDGEPGTTRHCREWLYGPRVNPDRLLAISMYGDGEGGWRPGMVGKRFNRGDDDLWAMALTPKDGVPALHLSAIPGQPSHRAYDDATGKTWTDRGDKRRYYESRDYVEYGERDQDAINNLAQHRRQEAGRRRQEIIRSAQWHAEQCGVPAPAEGAGQLTKPYPVDQADPGSSKPPAGRENFVKIGG